jgi:hypothetical protein
MTTLRGAWQLIGDTWNAYKKYFNDFVQPLAILLIATLIFTAPAFFPELFSANPLAIGIPYFILGIAYIFVSIWVSVLLTRISKNAGTNTASNLDIENKESYKRSLRYLGMSILYGLLISLPIVLVGILYILGAFIAQSVAFMVATTIIAVLVVFFVLYLSILYGFIPYQVALGAKKLGIKETFTHSKDLVQGRWWKVLWRLFAPQVWFGMIMLIVSGGIVSIITVGNLASIPETGVVALLINIITSVLQILFTPLLMIPPVLLYLDLQKTKK